jgi:DNA-binding CsgD family transcriptional regulator
VVEEGELRGLRKVPSAADVLKILGAAYQVEQPRTDWFKGLLRAVATTLPQDARVAGVLYDVSDETKLRVDAIDGVDLPSGWLQLGIEQHRDPRLARAIIAGYRSILCATLPELGAEHPPTNRIARRDYFDLQHVRGQTTINGLDCSGKGCSLYLLSRSPSPLSESEREVFIHIATHLSTAYRLQRRLFPDGPPRSAEVEAVIKPSGDVEHAEGGARTKSARQALRLAVRQREDSRKSLGVQAGAVLRRWRGLVAARWTLIDHYESGGQRFVLARENAPSPGGLAQLSERERQVASLAALGRSNKLIAYELGLAHSTVRVLVARACAKLAAPSRAELISRLSRADPG